MSRTPTKRPLTKRTDGRGHWTPGKRRSSLTKPQRARVTKRLKAAIEEYGSIRAVARALGKSDRTIRRLISGEDWPTTKTAQAVKTRL